MGSSEDNAKELVHRFICLDRMHHRIVDKFLTDLGVHRGQHFLLVYLAHCKVMPSQNELAQKLMISPTAVAVKIKKLESDGLIERTQNTADSRTNQVSLTLKGRNIIEQTERIFNRIDDCLTLGLTDEQLTVMLKCFEQMQSNLKKIESGEKPLPQSED